MPLRLYINDRGRAKVELGLARGKQLHDRRRDIAERDAKRDMERQLADAQRGALNRRRTAGAPGQRLDIERPFVVASLTSDSDVDPGDAWFRQGLAVREREPRCRQAS